MMASDNPPFFLAKPRSAGNQHLTCPTAQDENVLFLASHLVFHTFVRQLLSLSPAPSKQTLDRQIDLKPFSRVWIHIAHTIMPYQLAWLCSAPLGSPCSRVARKRWGRVFFIAHCLVCFHMDLLFLP